jgi:hypothetical protein
MSHLVCDKASCRHYLDRCRRARTHIEVRSERICLLYFFDVLDERARLRTRSSARRLIIGLVLGA